MSVKGITRSAALRLSLLLATTALVCSAQFIPSDAGNYAAKAVTLTGQVSVLKDFKPFALSVGDSVGVTERIVTGIDGHAVFQVSDGSTIEVFPNSEFVFRKNPPNWRDLLDVVVGKVHINIQHWGATPNPNRVVTPTAVISVRGTTFDVTVDSDDETTLVEVEEGQVQVEHALLPTDATTILGPGQQVRVYKNAPLARSFDKGNFLRQFLHAATAAIAIAGRSSGPRTVGLPGGGTGGSTGGPTVGDTGPSTPPPPTLPPPPPPPPPAGP